MIEETKDGALVCLMQGEININNSPELRKIFDGIIKRNEKRVLLDLASVSYIDSSGLATLIEMFQRLRKIGGKLRLCNMAEKIKSVFELTKLNKLFEIFDTQSAALKDF